MAKIRPIEQVTCDYGKPVLIKAKNLEKVLRQKAVSRSARAFEDFKGGNVDAAHPAPRIYNLTEKACFYRTVGSEFVRCRKGSDGRVRLD
jgi:hypothetical protein